MQRLTFACGAHIMRLSKHKAYFMIPLFICVDSGPQVFLRAAVVLVAACLAATAIPLRAISGMSVLASIETGE